MIVLQKSACENIQYWGLYGTLNIVKIGSMTFFLLAFQFHPFFIHFLIKLECWIFWCGFGPPFCMRLLRIFEIGIPSALVPLGRAFNPLPKVLSVPPILKRFLIELECWNFLFGLGATVLHEAYSNFWNLKPHSKGFKFHLWCEFD